MTINFKTIADFNNYLANGLPNFDSNDVDTLFDNIQSEARRVESIRAINAFSRVCLDY